MPLGTWDSENGILLNEFPHPTANGIDTHAVFNKTFIVLTVIVRTREFICSNNNLFILNLCICCLECPIWNVEGKSCRTSWK